MKDFEKAIEEAKAGMMPFESRGKVQERLRRSALSGIWGLNGISVQRLRVMKKTKRNTGADTTCGATGLCSSAGRKGPPTLTAISKG